jgi:hypothetical protein
VSAFENILDRALGELIEDESNRYAQQTSLKIVRLSTCCSKSKCKAIPITGRGGL